MIPNPDGPLESRVEALYTRVFGLPHAEQEAILTEHERLDPEACAEVRGVLRYEPSETVRQIPDQIGALIQALVSIPDPLTPPIPSSLPNHTGLDEIARGGFGVVCRALRARTNLEPEEAAVKLIWIGDEASEEDRQCILAEPRKLSGLTHPYIVKVHEAERQGGWLYYSMEYVRGGTFRQRMAEDWRDAVGKVELLIKVAQAMQYAHERGIIHFDLKPENILIDEVGNPKVADFGLALQRAIEGRLSETRARGWSPGYSAPELLDGKEGCESIRVDIFSLGAILFELYLGAPPHRREYWSEAELRETRGKLQRKAGRDLAAVILQCLETAPNRRYGSAEALAKDLDRWRRGHPVKALPPANRWLRWSRWLRYRIRRKPTATAVQGAVALVLVLVGLFVIREFLAHQTARTEQIQQQAALEESVAEIEQRLTRARFAPEGDEAPWGETLAVAERARGLIANGGAVGAMYRDRVRNLYAEILAGAGQAHEAKEQRLRDADMLARLKAIRLRSATPVRGTFDYAAADRTYAEAFRRYGVDFSPRMTREETATRLRGSALREQLVAALIDWMVLHMKAALTSGDLLAIVRANSFCQQLRETARSADADREWNRRFHAALASPLAAFALRSLAQTTDVEQLPPAMTALLGEVSGDFDAAVGVQLLRRAQAHHEDDFWINHFLALLLLELRTPEVGEALRYQSVCVALDPRNPLAHNLLGCTFARAQRLRDARVSFRRAVTLDSNLPEARANLIAVQAELEGLTAARQAFNECGPLRLDPSVRHTWAGVLLGCGAYSQAAGRYQEILDEAPKDGEAWYGLGRCLGFLGKYDRALAALRQPSVRRPKGSHCEPIPQVVQRLERLRQLDKRRSLAAGPGPASKAEEPLLLAKLYLDRGAYREAFTFYERHAEMSRLSSGDLMSAAIAAVLAGCGNEMDPELLRGEPRARWRQQALAWLREEMNTQMRSVASSLSTRGQVRQVLGVWRRHVAFAGVREPDRLARLPRHEQEHWRKFWAEVGDAIDRLSQSSHMTTGAVPPMPPSPASPTQ